MQQIPTFAGIDISKLTLDICILDNNVKAYYKIDNELQAIKTFFERWALQYPMLYIGMENTGCYNYPLYQALNELAVPYYVIPPIHLKKSLGLSRGKNDKIDSLRIAQFLQTNCRNLQVYKPQRAVVTQLRLLLNLRELRIKMKKQLMGNGEQYAYFPAETTAPLMEADNQYIALIDEQVKNLETQIQTLISNDAKLALCFKLISSVQGVGKILGWNLLVKTGEFDTITDPRKLACFAGVVPFDYSSGSSIRGRSKVSHYADKSLKKLLHLAAMSAIRLNGDLKDYYQRKVTEGKNKMSVLNAVRNKIIHRVYAVLKNQQPYQIYRPDSLVMS